MVDAELRLEPVGRQLARRHHDARVVHEHVETILLGHELGGRCHTREVTLVERDEAQIGTVDVGFDSLDGIGGALLGSTTQQHPAAALGEHLGGFEADSGVGTGDEEGPPGLVGDIGCREAAHATVCRAALAIGRRASRPSRAGRLPQSGRPAVRSVVLLP